MLLHKVYGVVQNVILSASKHMLKSDMKDIKSILGDQKKFAKQLQDRHKYVTKEYQDYGYRIAMKLGEPKNRVSLYIKLAKAEPRALLDQAFSFAVDYPNARNRGKLFMWKLKELKAERSEAVAKEDESQEQSKEGNDDAVTDVSKDKQLDSNSDA